MSAEYSYPYQCQSSLDHNCGNCANRVDGVCKVLSEFAYLRSQRKADDDADMLTVRPPDDFVCVKWEPPKQ